jgi:hypothetical protein
MHAIKKRKMGMRINPDISEGNFMAVEAVAPEKITAIVMIFADQKPNEAYCRLI